MSTTCNSVILEEERAQGEELDNTTVSLLESCWWQFQPLELIALTQRYAGGAGLLRRYPPNSPNLLTCYRPMTGGSGE